MKLNQEVVARGKKKFIEVTQPDHEVKCGSMK